MPKTVSVHNGSAANREHNRRNPRTTGQMPHIQQDLVHHNETWIDIPVREAYKQIFQTAVDDYNRRQSRPERKIRDYYNQIRKSAKKHTAYELIIQIGDKNDTGLSADNEIAMYDTVENVFARAPELLALGLSVPQVTKIFLKLREMGVDVPADVYTVPYAVKMILEAKKRRDAGESLVLPRVDAKKGGAATC